MFKKLFVKKQQEITIVSGLPRSGTSLMMKMLDAGGIQPVQDGIRTADSDNPKGYYEFERAKQLDKGDYEWLPSARGKAVKIITALLRHLPSDYEYLVLMMRRDINEVLASQTKMLKNRGEDAGADDAIMADLYTKHLKQTELWMNTQPNLKYIDVDYAQLVADPMSQLPQINQFLGGKLDVEAMMTIADPSLYRNRKTSSD